MHRSGVEPAGEEADQKTGKQGAQDADHAKSSLWLMWGQAGGCQLLDSMGDDSTGNAGMTPELVVMRFAGHQTCPAESRKAGEWGSSRLDQDCGEKNF
jgi:hypothetical protein